MYNGWNKWIGIRALTVTFMLAVSSLTVYSLDNQLSIAKANTAYMAGRYQDAIGAYLSVVSEGYESADLYYNIGNAYFKLSDIPHAILWYERARRLDPGNEDVVFNLNVANSRITDKIEPLPELFYRRWFRMLIDQFSADGWAKAGIALLLLSLLLGTVYIASKVLIIRKIGFWSAFSSLVVSFIFLFFGWSSYDSVQSDRSAIIMSPTVTIKSSPDEKSTDIFVLHEGSKVRLIDHIGNWYEIRIASGSVGWIQQVNFEKI
jgi:tetratricopeptide (TPR) repeat protein